MNTINDREEVETLRNGSRLAVVSIVNDSPAWFVVEHRTGDQYHGLRTWHTLEQANKDATEWVNAAP